MYTFELNEIFVIFSRNKTLIALGSLFSLGTWDTESELCLKYARSLSPSSPGLINR